MPKRHLRFRSLLPEGALKVFADLVGIISSLEERRVQWLPLTRLLAFPTTLYAANLPSLGLKDQAATRVQDDEIRLRVPPSAKVRHLQTRDHDELIRQLRPEALQQSRFLIVMLSGGDEDGDAAGHSP